MSRLDPRFFIPVIWVVYCTCTRTMRLTSRSDMRADSLCIVSISLSACLLQAYRREFFNKYGSFMQVRQRFMA